MSNLPDDVSPGDIDRHFGAPSQQRVYGTVEVDVSIEANSQLSEAAVQQALLDAVATDLDDGGSYEALHARIVDQLISAGLQTVHGTVDVGARIDVSGQRSDRELRSQLINAVANALDADSEHEPVRASIELTEPV